MYKFEVRKSKIRWKCKVLGIMSLCCLALIFFATNSVTPLICSAFYDDLSTVEYYYVDEIWDDENKVFYEDKLNELCRYITGVQDASARNFDSVEEIAGKTLNSKQIMENTEPNKEIIIKFGGLEWTPTYLSTSVNGDVILTLWLSNSHQEPWQDRPADEGEYYGFIDGTLYSDWSANFNQVSVGEVPSNMYGASYVRAVTLNNGGRYATSSEPASYLNFEQSSESVFAKFTMSVEGQNNDLTDFIEKPISVQWQKYQSGYSDADLNGDFPNEAWADDMPDDNFYKSDRNYAGIEGNNAWAYDNLWLPSISEIGYSDSHNGFWNVSLSQRQSHTEGRVSGRVGKTSGSAGSSIWTRTGHNSFSHFSFVVNNSGGGNMLGSGVNDSYAIRPALHLNFSKACERYTYMPAEKIEVLCSRQYISEQVFSINSIREVKLYYPDGVNFVVTSYTVNVGDGEQVNSDDDLVITYNHKRTNQLLTQVLPVYRNFITKDGIIMRSALGFAESVEIQNKVYTQKDDFKRLLGNDYKSVKNIDRLIEINIMQDDEAFERISLKLSVNAQHFGKYKKFYTYVDGVLQELTPDENGEIMLDKDCSVLIVASTLNVTLLVVCISASVVVLAAATCLIVLLVKKRRKQKSVRNQ